MCFGLQRNLVVVGILAIAGGLAAPSLADVDESVFPVSPEVCFEYGPDLTSHLRIEEADNPGFVATAGDIMIAATQTGILRFFDMSDPGSPVFLAERTVPPVTCLAARDTLVLVGVSPHEDGQLEVFSIADPHSPRHIQTLPLWVYWFDHEVSRPAIDCWMESDRAYLIGSASTGKRCLWNLEYRDGVFSRTASLRTAYGASSIVVANGYAYVTRYLKGLEVFDMRNPTRIVSVFNPTYDALAPTDATILGSLLYVSDSAGRLGIFDISDQTQPPVAISFFTLGCGNGQLLVRPGGRLALTSPQIGIFEADVSDPASPRPLGNRILPGGANRLACGPADVMIVCTGDGLLALADDTLDDFPTATVARSVTRGVEAVGGLLYTCSATELQILEPDEQGSVRMLGGHDLNGSAGRIFSNGRLAMVSGGVIEIFDVSNPAAPLHLAELPSTNWGGPGDVEFVGDFVIVAGNGLDACNPRVPGTAWTRILDGPVKFVESFGDFACALSCERIDLGGSSLHILDPTDPSDIRQMATLPLDGYASGLATAGRVAYVGLNQWHPLVDPSVPVVIRLLALDLADPLNPVVGGSIDFPDYITDLTVDGHYLYASTNSNILIFDISNPMQPTRAATSLGYRLGPVSIDRGVMHLALGSMGLLTAPAMCGDAIEAMIDIKPGSWTNAVDTEGRGLLSVALLTTAELDSRNVDVPTVRFGPGEAAPVGRDGSGVTGYEEDVDGDGDTDLLFYFRLEDSALDGAGRSARLGGRITDGRRFAGTDMITPLASGDRRLRPAPAATIHPNPFNPATRVSFVLEKSSEVAVTVFDVRGRVVTRLHQGILGAGEHALTWDGRDAKGRRSSSGSYFFRVEVQGAVAVEKGLLLR